MLLKAYVLLNAILTFKTFRFGMATELEKVVYPQFLHPMKHITLTASILMIVSLSLERYCAVHSPMEFRQV